MVAGIESYASCGIVTSAEMERSANALTTLPAAIPAQSMLDALAGQDRSALRGLLDALADLDAVERERSSLPRLDVADSAVLEAIERTAALAVGDPKMGLEESPAELRQKAERTSQACHHICEHLKAAAHIAQLAGIRGSTRGGAVAALARLAELVHHIADREGPIYQSELVARIARAHAFQRAGGKIEERVLAAAGKELPRTSEEDGKVVFWPSGMAPASVVPFRRADPHVRGAASIPLAELAGLAGELLAPGRDDATITEKMKEHFELGNLRGPTRTRFIAAIELAKEHTD